MEEAAVWKIAKNYTKEAGVRQLERKIGEICRKTAKEILTTERKKVTITKENLSEYLGREKYTYEMANSSDEIGIVRGLGMDKRGRRYASDRSQCNAGKRRTYAYGAARRCDERICQDGDQLYPFGK